MWVGEAQDRGANGSVAVSNVCVYVPLFMSAGARLRSLVEIFDRYSLFYLIKQVVAVLAVMLAGCPYVPISTNQPPERIVGILSDINALVLLEDGRVDVEALKLDTAMSSMRVVRVSQDAYGANLPGALDEEGQVQLDDLAYIIFTSGSTGKPKGVMIPHRGGSNTCLDMNDRFNVTAQDRVLCLAALSFDLSVYDIFGVMATGGTVIMPRDDLKVDPKHWLDLLEEHAVTVWNTAPPMMTMLLDYVASSDVARERFSKLSLRLVLLSGDFIPLKTAPTLKHLLPSKDLVVCSLGGATEASIWSCYHVIDDVLPEWKRSFLTLCVPFLCVFRLPLPPTLPSSVVSSPFTYRGGAVTDEEGAYRITHHSIPYGRALGNQKLVILDADLQPVHDLVHGEICILGQGLARGYWNDDDKTRKVFVPCDALQGERIYRTGDLGRYFPNGEIEILGRIDFQVKVNGFRVEIGEVEAGIKAANRFVGDAICLPVGKKGSMQLVAFVVCIDPTVLKDDASRAALLADIHEGLKVRVPSYALPQHTLLLPTWPMNPSGKVDRQSLKRMFDEFLESEAPAGAGPLVHMDPRNDQEKRLQEIWEEVLGHSGFGVMESFSQVGGTSIDLLRMAYKVNEAFATDIPFEALQQHKTIAALASYLVRGNEAEDTSDFKSFVVQLNASGSKPPCFFVAPVSGRALCYSALAEALGADQPLITLSHAQVCRGQGDKASIEDIAADLVAAVLEHLDTMPAGRRDCFSLGGWSMGGVLAVEMLLQLRRMGKQCSERVILVDSPAPLQGITLEAICDEAGALLQFVNDLTAFDRVDDLPTSTQLAQSATPRHDMPKALQDLGALPKELPLAEFEDMFAGTSLFVIVRACLKYVYSLCSGNNISNPCQCTAEICGRWPHTVLLWTVAILSACRCICCGHLRQMDICKHTPAIIETTLVGGKLKAFRRGCASLCIAAITSR